MADHYSKSL